MLGFFIFVHHEQSKGRVEISVSGTWRAYHCIHLQKQTHAFPLHRYQSREENSPICYYRVHFSTGTSAQQDCSEEIHRYQEQALYLEEVFQLAEQCSRKMQEANLLGHTSSLSLQSTVNEISSAEVNEGTQGCWKQLQQETLEQAR